MSPGHPRQPLGLLGDVRRQEEQQLGLGLAADVAPERLADDRDVAQQRHLALRHRLAVFHQPADHNRLPVLDAHPAIGRALGDHRRAELLVDGDLGAGELRHLRDDLEDNQAVGVDVGHDVEADADIDVFDVGDRVAGVGNLGIDRAAHLLADEDRGDLVVAGENVGPRQHVEGAGSG